MYNPVRGGNRGGKDQFKWDQVRLMSYKDREQYVGYSTKIGYLDKGGKWRKKDWYTHIDQNNQTAVLDEIKQAQLEDERRIKKALGYKVEDQPQELPKLSKDEILELTNKIKQPNHAQQLVEEDQDEDRMNGLGFDLNQDKLRQVAANRAQNNSYFDINPNRLEGEYINKDEDIEKKIKKEEKKLLKEQKKYQELLKQQKKLINGRVENPENKDKKQKHKHKHNKHSDNSEKENKNQKRRHDTDSEKSQSPSRSQSKSKKQHK